MVSWDRKLMKHFTAALLLISASSAFAQKQELGLTLGQLTGTDRRSVDGTSLTLGSGTALQADYEYRLIQTRLASVYAGAHFLANPQRVVTGASGALTRDVATIYITPGAMVKFFPGARIQPWATVGGGAAVYEQSLLRQDGKPNPAPRDVTHGAFTYGGGVDVPIWKFVALRGEVRDFYSGNPAYNVGLASGQHNVVAGGGFVLRFGH